MEDSQLDMEMVIDPDIVGDGESNLKISMRNLRNTEHGLLNSSPSFHEATEKEKDSGGEWKGFCVYGDRIALYGYDGLGFADIGEKSKRKKSIYALKNKVMTPIKVNILSPLFTLFNLFQ